MGTAKTNITLLVFFVAQQFAFAENLISVDSLTYHQKHTSGDFLPNIKLVENDIIEFPLILVLKKYAVWLPMVPTIEQQNFTQT
tara:strand:+ start:365 stop:616 length:252 start_codon:yes stop_codon:yes gene_type:complete